MDLQKPDEYSQIPLQLAVIALGPPYVTHSLYLIFLCSYFLSVNPPRIFLALFFSFSYNFHFSSHRVQSSRVSGSYWGKTRGASLTDKGQRESYQLAKIWLNFISTIDIVHRRQCLLYYSQSMGLRVSELRGLFTLLLLWGSDWRETGEQKKEKEWSQSGNGYVPFGFVSCFLILSIYGGTEGFYRQ